MIFGAEVRPDVFLITQNALADNDSFGFFERAGGLLRTGPTATNVMDLALVALDGRV